MPKIAIIEDDQAISQMYRMKFEAEGFAVETAANGKLGLELIDKMRPDIILLDLMMPEMTGDEMLVKLRQIRVVALLRRRKQRGAVLRDNCPPDLRNFPVFILLRHPAKGAELPRHGQSPSSPPDKLRIRVPFKNGEPRFSRSIKIRRVLLKTRKTIR